MLLPDADERRRGGESACEYAARNAGEKARSVLERARERRGGSFVLAADTVVVSPGGEVLEKPGDPAEAARMLQDLSGRVHMVVSAYLLLDADSGAALASGVVETRVSFRELDPEEISRYVESGESMDKAGAYAIQGAAASFVDRIEGSYTNVVGLPLAEVTLALRHHGAEGG